MYSRKEEEKAILIVNNVLILQTQVDFVNYICYNIQACVKRKVKIHTRSQWIGRCQAALPDLTKPSPVVEKTEEDIENVSYHDQAVA